MSTVMDIAVEPPILLKPHMRIGEVIPKLSELKVRTAPVVDENGVLIGVLSYRTILSRGVGRDTKVSTVMDPPYSIDMKMPLDKAIATMVSWRARDAPVVDESGKVVGYLNRLTVLKYLLDQGLIPSDTVDNIMSSPAVVIQEWESIARARWLMLKNAFSRLPVVDSNDRVVGVVTLSDIVERLYSIRLSRRKGYEWIESEESFLAAPVGELMSTPPVTISLGSSISKAVELMVSREISGLPVVSDRDVARGVISGIDVLRRYVERYVTVYPIEASLGSAAEDAVAKAHVERIVNNYLAGFSRYVNVIDFKIAVKEVKKSGAQIAKDVRRGYQVSAKIVTDVGSVTAKTMCWDLPTCVREAMNIIERRLRKHVEKRMARTVPRRAEEHLS